MQGKDASHEMNTPAVGLFQKAHGKMVMLQRLEAQLAALLDQRRRVQDELTALQSNINEEFDRVMRQADEAPARLLSEIAETGNNSPARGRLTEVAESVA